MKLNGQRIQVSDFLKDLLVTAISQVGVVLFGILLLKIMAQSLSKEYFGLFILVRRWVGVLLPVMTLNLSFGMTRYIGFQKENARKYLDAMLGLTLLTSLALFTVLLVFQRRFAVWLYNEQKYSGFVLLLVLFLLANWIHLFAYAYFRGKMDMMTTNLLRVLFYGFPVLLAFLLMLFYRGDGVSALTYYFVIYSLWGLFIGFFFLRKDMSFFILGRGLFQKIKESGKILFFSLVRLPAVCFDALAFSIPVFFATHKISLVAAGYMGIVVAVIRLFELFSMPFNMIFVPKFSDLNRQEDMESIKSYSRVVLDFIITFLPLAVVMVVGLTRFLIRVWFGAQYEGVSPSVSAAIMFAVFYLAFALIRGILDGLFVFPFVSVIGFAGILTTTVGSLLFGTSVYALAIWFGLGLLVLGLSSAAILIKKLSLSPGFATIGAAVLLCLASYGALYYLDGWSDGLLGDGWAGLGLKLAYRGALALVLYWFYWRRTLWFHQVMKRVVLRPTEG
jgi:O-antigen/teichoic acid export membrane protein